ncbi:glycosyltransferase family 4 protein [Candidatus Pacearchaeota archaeon]|nr:glycosyltransferase family 4 protein [Candidatus Pacearchaeota archaeon]
MTSMKIGIVTNAFYPGDYAASKRVSFLAEELCRRGHKVRVITNDTNAKKNIDSPDLEIIKIRGKSYFFSIKTVLKRKLFRDLDYLFATSSNYFNGIPLIFNKNIPIKHFDIRDSPFLGSEVGERPYWVNKIYYWIGVLSLRLSQKKTALSKGLAKKFPEFDIKVFPNGADLNKFYPMKKNDKILKKLREKLGLDEKEKIIGYVGNIRLDEAPFEVREFMIKNMGKYKFLIAGEGDHRYIYDELKDNYPEKFIVLGHVNHNEIPGLINLCEKTIAFDYDSPERTCAIPLKIYESIACGVPVIHNKKNSETAKILKKYDFYTKEGCLKNRLEVGWQTTIKKMVNYMEKCVE